MIVIEDEQEERDGKLHLSLMIGGSVLTSAVHGRVWAGPR